MAGLRTWDLAAAVRLRKGGMLIDEIGPIVGAPSTSAVSVALAGCPVLKPDVRLARMRERRRRKMPKPETPAREKQLEGSPKPTLGYPSRTVAALALRDEGLSPAQIAERIGCSLNNVRVLLHKADEKTRTSDDVELTIHLPPSVAEELARDAHARGMSRPAFVSKLVSLAVREDLVPAIMDDGL